jgi:hypothetical protein
MPVQPTAAGTNPLAGHPKYEKIQDLSSGSFGFVQVSSISVGVGAAGFGPSTQHGNCKM